VQINRFCASGLEAVNMAAQKVRCGWEDLVVAGGVESMSRVPIGSDGGAWAMDPETNSATAFVPQGIGADLIATVTAFTAESIAENYRRFVLPRHPIDEVIVGGGGSYNPTLVRMIRERVGGIPVVTCEDRGVNSDAKESIAFALLANDAALGLPTNVPGATGARHPVVMGKFLPGR
jgi:1,6-anhydro-N-acetylmuramate kinase